MHPALLPLALLSLPLPQGPVVSQVDINTGPSRFAGAFPVYSLSISVEGTGLTGVDVVTPGSNTPQALVQTDESWRYQWFGYSSLDDIANDPLVGFGTFDFTFHGAGVNESASVTYDPGCGPTGCTDPHTGFGDVTFPAHGQTGVPLNPTLVWQCPPMTTCGNFGWYMELHAVAGPGLSYEATILDPSVRTWTPGCLTGNTLYELWLASGSLLNNPPLMVPTQPSGNLFAYYESFDSVNVVQFATQAPVGASYCAGNPNSSGAPGLLCVAGSPVAAQNDLQLYALDLPAGQFGYFLAGQTQGSFTPPGSQGIICLSGNIGRYNQAANIIQGPEGSIALDLGAIPVNPPAAVQPGDTWNFQCWYRDSNPGTTSNFSEALSIVFM